MRSLHAGTFRMHAAQMAGKSTGAGQHKRQSHTKQSTAGCLSACGHACPAWSLPSNVFQGNFFRKSPKTAMVVLKLWTTFT